jgi:tetratricopeptide (TPR) repeat protein
MPAKSPNERLAAALREAAISNKALARGVRDLSIQRGTPVACDHTLVSRWLSGTVPRPATARLVAEVIATRVGRTVTLREIGFGSADQPDPTLGVAYADQPTQAVSALTQLWQYDRDEAQIIVGAPPHSGAWADAALAWLVRTDVDSRIERSIGRSVGLSDVEAIHATSEMFSQLDSRFGGAHARRSLVQYLSTSVADLLGGSYSDATGQALFTATAESTLLAAWMSYDAGVHGLAQRYFIQALRLADAAGDRLLAGSILDAMSHQATFLKRHREAANLARAARTGTRGIATATLTAHFHAMEARALALGGDRSAAEKALSEAVRVYERRQPGADPDWIGYFDDAELSAEFSHCYRDIGRHKEAVAYAERATSGASVRSDFFVTMVKTAGQLGDGNLDQSLATLRAALDGGRTLKSARCVEYLRQHLAALARYDRDAIVQQFTEEYRDHPLWVAARSD